MFLQQPGLLVKTPASHGGAADEAVEQGVWINADPIKGCIVCNVGESECSENIAQGGRDGILILWGPPQCGRFGQMDCIKAHYTGSFTGAVTIGAQGHLSV